MLFSPRYFKANRKSIKSSTSGSPNNHSFERSACLWDNQNILNVSNTLILQNIFVKSKCVFENFVPVQEPLIEMILMNQQTKCPYSYCSLSTGVSSECVFSLWISLTEKLIFAVTIRNNLNTNVSCFTVTAI